MTHRIGDRIKEQAASSGLADFTLSGAIANFEPFSSIPSIAVGDTTWYCAINDGEWEIGVGTYSGASTLARAATPLQSSNGDAKVNFSAPPVVFCTVPASALSTLVNLGFRAYLSANQTGIVNNVGTRVAFNAESYDDGACHNAGVFTAPVAGKYSFGYNVYVRGTTLTVAVAGLRRNGADQSYGSQGAPTGNAQRISGTDTFKLNAGDTVDVVVYLTGTGLLADGSSAPQSTWWGKLEAA